MAARWQAGEGRVAAAAFRPSTDVAQALAQSIERPPRDPRFRVTVDAGSTTHVIVDATAGGTSYLNGEDLALELGDGSPAQAKPIPQTAPGRYELTLDAPTRETIARVRRGGGGGQTIDAFALAGRYAPEFDAVGNDRAALEALARRTGGRMIEPGDTRRLELPFTRREAPLTSWLTLAGAALICAGLVRWRIGS
jgi:hypothetical protein